VLGVDDATWARGRGWAVTSVRGISYHERTNPGIVAAADAGSRPSSPSA